MTWQNWLSTHQFQGGRSQDDSGIGQGDHFLPYKFIKRTVECWANSTKQLIASRGYQAPRKAANCLRNEVGQNIKDKKRDKRVRDGDPSREGSHNRGSFQTPTQGTRRKSEVKKSEENLCELCDNLKQMKISIIKFQKEKTARKGQNVYSKSNGWKPQILRKI